MLNLCFMHIKWYSKCTLFTLIAACTYTGLDSSSVQNPVTHFIPAWSDNVPENARLSHSSSFLINAQCGWVQVTAVESPDSHDTLVYFILKCFFGKVLAVFGVTGAIILLQYKWFSTKMKTRECCMSLTEGVGPLGQGLCLVQVTNSGVGERLEFSHFHISLIHIGIISK